MEEFKFKRYIYFGIFLFAVSIIPYAIFFVKEYGFCIKADSNTWGQFGSYIGGILSPIFAFFSFIALLRTIDLQSKDIYEKREEFKVQKILAEEQKKLLDIQKFETTFFNMLNQITNIVNNYTYNQQEGASFFRNALENLWGEFRENTSDSKAIDEYFKKSQDHIEFKNFVLHIANIIKIIKISELEDKSKDIYYEILLGFLSNRQKYFIELCGKSEFFNDEREYLNIIHRSEKRWI